MFDSLRNALPYITGALFLLALILFLVSVRLFRRSRTDIFWRRRREAGQRGWRLFVLASTIIFLSAVSCLFTLIVAVVGGKDDQPAATAFGQSPDQSATPAPDAGVPTTTNGSTPAPPITPVPGTPVIVVVTATPVYTPTETPFPTFTPNSPPLVSSVTPQPNAAIHITALDDQISDQLTPIDPRTAFAAGTHRIYLFVDYSNMTRGVLWKRTLLRDGVEIEGGTYTWGLDSEGIGYFFFGNDTGFEPGLYEIRLFIGETSEPVSTAPFSIVPAP